MKKIGPILSVADDFVPNMQDAYDTDFESGANWLNNLAAERMNKLCPTVMAMAALIEQERDKFKLALEDIALECETDSYQTDWQEILRLANEALVPK